MVNIKIETIAAAVGNGRGNHLNLSRLTFYEMKWNEATNTHYLNHNQNNKELEQ